MDILGWVLVIFLYLLGFLSCFINKIPGPMICAVATAAAKLMLESKVKGGWDIVAVVFGLAILAIILSKLMTKLAKSKLQDYSKGASRATTWACILGLIILLAGARDGGLIFFLILGFVILPYAFAFLVELIKQKKANLALKSAGSCFLVYVADTMMKIVTLYVSVYYMFMAD